MIIEEITVTAFQQHTRILGCEATKQAICIDPGDEAERIVETLERRGLTLQAIALTHAHLDHVGGVAALKKLQPAARINLHQGDEFMYQALPEQPSWIGVELPLTFSYSTAVILLSSLTVHLALGAFKERRIPKYRKLISITVVLGVLFMVMQYIGFMQLWKSGLHLNGSGGVQFLYIIFGLHGLHVLGGIIALLVMFVNAFNTRHRNYNVVPVDVASTYWHFVDVLWIYLFIFFLLIS